MSEALPLKIWDGEKWVNIGVQSGQVLYQNEEPSSPQTGSIWIDSDDETSVLNDQDFLTINSASAIYAPSASPTFSGQVNLPATTNYDGNLLSATLGSKLDLAGGKILQIVRATDTTNRSTTSTSFVDASISVTITPQKNDSAIILIWVNSNFKSAANDFIRTQITDNSNNTISGAEASDFGSDNSTALAALQTLVAYSTPSTTNATTYKGRFRSSTGNFVQISNGTTTGQMYAIEVSA